MVLFRSAVLSQFTMLSGHWLVSGWVGLKRISWAAKIVELETLFPPLSRLNARSVPNRFLIYFKFRIQTKLAIYTSFLPEKILFVSELKRLFVCKFCA